MAEYSIEDGLADFTVGLTRTIAMICNHLIDQNVLNRDLLIADLNQVHSALEKKQVGELGLMVPLGLAGALQQNSELQP